VAGNTRSLAAPALCAVTTSTGWTGGFTASGWLHALKSKPPDRAATAGRDMNFMRWFPLI
jgi:hypothetical protein